MVAPSPAAEPSSRVVKYRMPTISSTPATIAAMIGSLLLRLPRARPGRLRHQVSPFTMSTASTRIVGLWSHVLTTHQPQLCPVWAIARRTTLRTPVPRYLPRPSSLLTLRLAKLETIRSIHAMTVFMRSLPSRASDPSGEFTAGRRLSSECHGPPTHRRRRVRPGVWSRAGLRSPAAGPTESDERRSIAVGRPAGGMIRRLAGRRRAAPVVRSGHADRPELNADPGSHRTRRFRDGVLPCALAASAHDHQVTVTDRVFQAGAA